MSKDSSKETTKTKTNAVADIMPELVELLEAGAHFGHERSKRNPKMEKYIFVHRNRVAIVDLEQTLQKLQEAAQFAHSVASVPSNNILFVGTKRQARHIIEHFAHVAGQPFVTKRWLGGTLTNFSTILKSIEKLDELQRTQNSPQVENLTKKEKSVRRKEMERLGSVLEGIKNMTSLPAAMFVIDVHDERIAVREANRMKIPVIGISDTNADPSSVNYPIPANDDAIRSLTLITSVITKAILKARGKSTDIPAALVSQKPAPLDTAGTIQEETESSDKE